MASTATQPPVAGSERVGGAGIEIRGLAKRFGAVRAVDDVSLSVQPGEFLALLGPSGSGKTSILMSIAGFELPDAGSIAIDGRDVTYLPASQRNLGMVFQKYTLFPHLSVLDNVAFGLKMRGVARAERHRLAEQALATVRLDGYGKRMPAQLSGGQQQRVALARAIVYKPKVLLMDEPLSALDKNLREEMQLEIKRLQSQLGITVVFVTHDQGEALTMADRVAILNQGRIQQLDAPKALYERPRTRFVAGFIGETNFMPAEIGPLRTQGALVQLPGGASPREVRTDALVGRVAAGGRAVAALRPEQIVIGSPEDPAALRATVSGVIYSGSTVLCIAQLSDGTELRARLPDPSRVALAAGDRVGLLWPADALRIYGEEVAAA
ncbi:ABC transporter ATP-binding protein [Variovorax sp.]|jgi:spermidine/putrescine ABC transporter ATP-binding subunit|uniref:ABC transporter ATP-binding protein n=1 Tax=Variovorax sp. TaxID=1871043 RepID=UPI00120A17D0|nr:ABC transporter ATP-binding protein [Variovorax sp.]TAJ59276.1 MAG: ABC transporter ATP-binding protein [Variovorax sp.]